MKVIIGKCIYCNAPLYHEEQGDYEQTFWGQGDYECLHDLGEEKKNDEKEVKT